MLKLIKKSKYLLYLISLMAISSVGPTWGSSIAKIKADLAAQQAKDAGKKPSKAPKSSTKKRKPSNDFLAKGALIKIGGAGFKGGAKGKKVSSAVKLKGKKSTKVTVTVDASKRKKAAAAKLGGLLLKPKKKFTVDPVTGRMTLTGGGGGLPLPAKPKPLPAKTPLTTGGTKPVPPAAPSQMKTAAGSGTVGMVLGVLLKTAYEKHVVSAISNKKTKTKSESKARYEAVPKKKEVKVTLKAPQAPKVEMAVPVKA